MIIRIFAVYPDGHKFRTGVETMKKQMFLTGIFVLALVFGMIFAGCDNGSTPSTNTGSDSNSGKNPLEGTWLSEDFGMVLYFGSETSGTLYRVVTNWNGSSLQCKVNEDMGVVYKVGYYEDDALSFEYSYQLNTAKTELKEWTVDWETTYIILTGPKSPDNKSPLAGFWVESGKTEPAGLAISRAMTDDFIILYGECKLVGYTIENGRSKIGGANATAYKYFKDIRGQITLEIWIEGGRKNFIRADTLYDPAPFF
jgi:hypothetical protein